MSEPRKRRKSFNAPGHAHELTFSCYRRRPFLVDDSRKLLFLESLEQARAKHNFLVWAYVIMPEHVHLIVLPLDDEYDVGKILQSVKQPVGRITIHRAKELGKLAEFAVPNRDEPIFRFWQPGGGYNRNLTTAKAIWAAIHYIHMNPVKRGLVDSPGEYEWSSFNAYDGRDDVPFRVDRCEVWLS